MNHTQHISRFKVNPVEITIFLILTLSLFNSAYQLFYKRDRLTSFPLLSFHSNLIDSGRSLATSHSGNFGHSEAPVNSSASPASGSSSTVPMAEIKPLVNLEVPCKNTFQFNTSASKARLSGYLCGPGFFEHPTMTKIGNSRNQTVATVFTSQRSQQFSTDYISLEPGSNPIHLEFLYASGKVYSQEIEIFRD